MRALHVTKAEERMIDAISDLGIDVDAFVRKLESAVAEGRKHPLTIAAAHVESASFETSVERGESPAPSVEF